MPGLGILIVSFIILVFGAGPALMPAKLGSPLQRVVIGVVVSLTLLYLSSFGIYVLDLPENAHWFPLVGAGAIAWHFRLRLGELWNDPEVRRGAFAWLAVTAWLLGWQFTVYSYSGSNWQGDWYEHYDRTCFFLEHWELGHQFLGAYSLSARPPLANLLNSGFLALAGINFHVFQASSTLLASLVVWPVYLLQRRFARPGPTVSTGWTTLLLMALPALVQNATFTWTKLPTAFFVLTGIALLSEKTPSFPTRLAAWLSLTAGMLAHYSAGPWIIAVAIAEFVRHAAGWDRIFRRQAWLISLACGLLFATWLGWSTLHLGLDKTLRSNTTVTSGAGLTWLGRLGNAAENLYYTAVPVWFRHVDYGKYLAEDPVGRLRDSYFNAVQSSMPMIAGSLGVLVAAGLLWAGRKQSDRTAVRYWTVLLAIGLVLGVAVHTETMPIGVGQICLLPFALLVVAWLAARLPGRPVWQKILALGLVTDVTLGIVLHFGVQSFWLPRWLHPGQGEFEIVGLLGVGARANLEARQRIAEPFLHDLPGDLPATVLLLLTAVVLLAMCFRLPASAGIKGNARAGGAAPPQPVSLAGVMRPIGVTEPGLAWAVFTACLCFNLWGIGVGWESKSLPGSEDRQTETAISTFFIKLENNFSPAYPTPVMGKPWSIPEEFPLYQWTVVVVGKLTGLGLTKAARAVSIACFYLTLPAIYLLLARWRVTQSGRWLVLAMVLCCPFYIFYARGILIESMALMFSLWFWVVSEFAVERRSIAWLGIALLVGTAASLVKMTTFALYLVPPVLWCAGRLRAGRLTPRWRMDLVWIVVAVALPLAAGCWWLHYAAVLRAQNPLAAAFGSGQAQLSGGLETLKTRILPKSSIWVPTVVGCMALALTAGRHRWKEISLCTILFVLPLAVLPSRYTAHEYYFMANVVLLPLAMGLVLVALAESPALHWLAWPVMLGLVGGQVCDYLVRYYPVQCELSAGGNGLSDALKALTLPDEYVVITGPEANFMIPYFAQRRAMLLRPGVENDRQRVLEAWTKLAGEKLGALVVAGPLEQRQWIITEATKRGLVDKPLILWRDVAAFLPAARRQESLNLLADTSWHEVRPGPDAESSAPPRPGTWFEVGKLDRKSGAMFDGMRPRPARCFSSFGLMKDDSFGRYHFGAHPVTRLVFALPAGRHVLRTSLQFSPEAYRTDMPDDKTTDGVEFSLFALEDGKPGRLFFTRLLNPKIRSEDRGDKPMTIEFDLAEAGEIELFIGPGPQGRDTRDWVMLGALTIN